MSAATYDVIVGGGGGSGLAAAVEARAAGAKEILSSGAIVDAVKAKFPWARGAMVIHIQDTKTQL